MVAAAEPTESAAAEPTESAAAEAEPAVDGSDGWAAANHRQVPLKKHDGGWVRPSSLARCPHSAPPLHSFRPSSLTIFSHPPLLFLPPRPSSRSRRLQSLARLDDIRVLRYVRSPRAAARSRAALTPRHLPPLSSPLPPLPATPPSSYAPSFAELPMLLVHGRELDVLLHSQQPNAHQHQTWIHLQRNGRPNRLHFLQ